MLLPTVVFLLLTVSSAIRDDPDLSVRVEALEARAERAEQEVEQLKGRELELEQEIQQLKNKLTSQDSSSFFSVQFTADTNIPYLDIMDFDDVIVNYGDDYIQSGGLYM